MAIPRFLSKLAGLLDSSGKVTQSALAANVVGNGPAFSAYSTANQSFASSTFVKIAFPSEEYDTNSCYDVGLSRFTPTVAGYYVVAASASMSTNVSQVNTLIHKNGAQAKGGYAVYPSAAGGGSAVTAMVYLNGTTDYVETYIYAIGTSPVLAAGAVYTYFQGSMIRSAT